MLYKLCISVLRALPKLHSPSLNGEAELENMWRHLLLLLSAWAAVSSGESSIATTSFPLHYSTCVVNKICRLMLHLCSGMRLRLCRQAGGYRRVRTPSTFPHQSTALPVVTFALNYIIKALYFIRTICSYVHVHELCLHVPCLRSV